MGPDVLKQLMLSLGVPWPIVNEEQEQGSDPGPGAAVAAGVVVDVMMADNGANRGYETVNDAVTTLRTSGFAGCYGIVLLGPGNIRTLAHINADHYPVTVATWDNLAAFQALATAAHAAHIYHCPGYDYRSSMFITYFGLHGLEVVVHGNPAVVSVDPLGNVTL